MKNKDFYLGHSQSEPLEKKIRVQRMLLTNLEIRRKQNKANQKRNKIPKRSQHALKNRDTHFSFGNRNIVLEFVNRSAKSTFAQIRTHNNGMYVGP